MKAGWSQYFPRLCILVLARDYTVLCRLLKTVQRHVHN